MEYEAKYYIVDESRVTGVRYESMRGIPQRNFVFIPLLPSQYQLMHKKAATAAARPYTHDGDFSPFCLPAHFMLTHRCQVPELMICSGLWKEN